MTSHDLARMLFEKPDLPILIMPKVEWTGSIYLEKIIEGYHIYSPDGWREPGPVIVLQITNDEKPTEEEFQ